MKTLRRLVIPFRTALLLTCIAALATTLGPASSARASTLSCEIHYMVNTQWPASSQAPGGFSGGLTIKNTATTTITSWTVHFTFPMGSWSLVASAGERSLRRARRCLSAISHLTGRLIQAPLPFMSLALMPIGME